MRSPRLHRPLSLALAAAVTHLACVGAPLDDTPVSQTEAVLTPGVLPRSLRVAVVLYNFSDHTDTPLSRATVQDMVFGGTGTSPATTSVRRYYEEVTGNAMSLSGDVFDWVTLPQSAWAPTGRLVAVDHNLIPAIDTAAASRGFVRSNYDLVIYATSFAIQGVYMGGGVIFAEAMRRDTSVGIFAHEIGHALTLSHANTYTCTASGGEYVSIADPSRCTPREYNDGTSVMGTGSPLYHPSVYEKLAMGAFTAAQVPDVTGSGRFRIAPLEAASATIARGLRIPVSRPPWQGHPAGYYYVSFRTPTGFDAPLATTPHANALAVHYSVDWRWLGTSTGGGGTVPFRVSPLQLDATPATGNSFTDSAITVGRRLEDPYEGLSIQLVSVDATGATVDITRRTIASSRAPVSGSSAALAVDHAPTTGLVTGYDNWQYVQIDAGYAFDLRRLRRKMRPGATVPYANRTLQGEQVSYSLDGVTWTTLPTSATTGWERFVAYAPTAWHSVGYEWSPWLSLRTPVRARYLRFHWDGNGPTESLDEVEYE